MGEHLSELHIEHGARVSAFALRHAHNYFIMGKRCAENGTLAESRRHLLHCLRHDPNYLPALRMLATLEYTLGDLPAARKTLTLTLARTTPDPELLFLAGNIALSDHNPREAADAFHHAELLGGTSVELYFNMGLAHLVLGEGEPAARAVQNVLAQNPLHHRAWDALGCARRLMKDYDGALDAFKRTLQLEPAFHETRDHLAQLLMELNHPDMAREVLEVALANDPQRRSSRHLLGMAHAASANYPEAVACWETNIAQGDATPEAYLLLANAYLHLDDPAQAMLTLETLLTLFPAHLPGHLQLALLYLEHGKRVQGWEHIEQACALDPNNPMLAHVLKAVTPRTHTLRPSRDA